MKIIFCCRRNYEKKFVIKSIPKSECNYCILPFEKIVSFRERPKDYIEICNIIMNLLISGAVVWIEEVSHE